MSRYLLLFLLTLPFILGAILSIVTQYKLGKLSRRRFFVQTSLWVAVLVGIAFAQPFYVWLFNNRLTDTEPLSLFDVVQITAIISVFYIANRARVKVDLLQRQVQDLHQELSIQLSKKK
ncbi:MAG: hypothetical protein JWO54_190 [Candidatus Saccharibacteria bacterium]|nr:hypothetical protein [Candidatus Saccharibacteria bacterium]